MIEAITGKTKLTGLLGSPVYHSISPMMHNEAFGLLGLDYVYLAFDVDTDRLKDAVEGLKAIGVHGFNLTMPNKNKMLELVDHISPAAAMIGAVNTVVNKDGILWGHNTDGTGYMKAAAHAGHQITGKKMTLLGAGGAATAVCVQAAIDGVAAIDLYSLRDAFFERAKKMAENVEKETGCQISIYDLEDSSSFQKSIEKSAILVNGTSVGMSPHENDCILTDPSVLRPDLIVSDVIYNPRETKLLRLAKERGCSVFNGLYMLLYQGAEAFRLWTGQEMPLDIISSNYFNH